LRAADAEAMTDSDLLPVVRAAELDKPPPDEHWLVEKLWPRHAVGVIGGRPKSCKSWLGLDLALSVASATPCLGRFAVEDSGPALVYLAEDALGAVRERLDSLCRHRELDLRCLDLFVITAPSVRLDQPADQRRLAATLAELRPKLLLLDPLVRLHRLDESSSGDISGLLGYLRELERRHSAAVVLVHHMGKRHRSDLGQALRGSSDVHAWTDASLYLTRKTNSDSIVLNVEHRSAQAPEPVELKLVADSDGGAYLEITSDGSDFSAKEATVFATPTLSHRVLEMLGAARAPLRRSELRERLAVNNQRLGEVLAHLENAGQLDRSADGWALRSSVPF
jgi:hypothetical protein